MKTFREIAEMHYPTEPNNEFDKQYRINRINALEKLLTEQCNIANDVGRSEQLCGWFLPDSITSSATRCQRCGREKLEHPEST